MRTNLRTRTRARAAMGCQWWRPAESSTKGRCETASGSTRTVPDRREGIGAVTSSIEMLSAVPSQCSRDGPMARLSASRFSAVARRSVMAQRLGRP